MPKVSVVIPTYNRAKYIDRALKSVFDQTFKDIEVIVIDDGSQDNTKEVLAKYNGQIKYFYQNNQGISNARNRGIKEATGEYIAFLDSDDEWITDKIQIQVNLLDKNDNLGIVCSKMRILDNHGKARGMKPEEQTGRNFRELIEIGGDLPTSTVMTRKECFDKVGLFDESLAMMEDFEMWVRIASQYEIHNIPDAILGNYYRHESQITKNKTLIYETTINLQKKIKSLYQNLPGFPSETVEKRLAFNEYLLSRIYFSQRKYHEAFDVLMDSFNRKVGIGSLFFKKSDSITQKAAKLFKSYGYLIVSFMTWIACGGFLRRKINANLHSSTVIKVLVIHEHYDNIAGQELDMLDRMNGLREVGVECSVLLEAEGIFAERLRELGYDVVNAPLNRLSKINPFPYLKTVFAIRRIVKKGRFNIIHCSGAYPNQYGLPAARLAGVPCVVHLSTTVYSKNAFKTNFVKHADRVFGVSEAVRKNVLKNISMAPHKVKTIYAGVVTKNNQSFADKCIQLKKTYGIADNTVIIGQISSIIPRKGIEEFVTMARDVKKQFPETVYLIVGKEYDDGYTSAIKSMIKDFGLTNDVIFTGYHDDIFPFYELIDIHVLASKAEGLARVIPQAQMAKKPIVATNVSGNAEAIIHGETGLLVPSNDVSALTDAVVSLLKDPQKAQKIGENSYNGAMNIFSIQSHAKNLKRSYMELV